MKYKIELLKTISKMEMTDKDIQIFVNAVNQKRIDGEFLWLVCSHKLHNLLLKHLVTLRKLFYIEKTIAFILNERFIFTQNRTKEYFDMVSKVVPRLEKADIKYSFLKGISIARGLYESKGLIYRSFNDVDILISKNQVDLLNDILESLGFVQGIINSNYLLEKATRRQKIYWSLNSHQEHKYLKDSSFSIYSPGVYSYFDVNTTIFRGGMEKPLISTDVLLENIRLNYSIDNLTFNSLDYTYELIQLCIHLYKDTFNYDVKKDQHEDYSLIQFCDIREFILKYRERINWIDFLSIINSNNIGTYIYTALSLVEGFYKDLNINAIIEQIEYEGKVFEMPDWEKVLIR